MNSQNNVFHMFRPPASADMHRPIIRNPGSDGGQTLGEDLLLSPETEYPQEVWIRC